jgi:hypothetical protein
MAKSEGSGVPFSQVNALDMVEFGEALITRGEEVMGLFDAWNAEIRALHDRNSHLYLRELRIREPPASERRMQARSARSPQSYQLPVDPLSTTLDQINFELRTDVCGVEDPEVLKFQRSKTFSHYRDLRAKTLPDPTVRVNQIRTRGPDDASAHVNEIPNSGSKVGPPDTPSRMRLRKLRMRDTAFQTAQSARGDRPLTVPVEVKRTIGRPRVEERPLPKLLAFQMHRETKAKIAKLEKALHDSLVVSAAHIRRMNDEAANQKFTAAGQATAAYQMWRLDSQRLD